MQFWYISSLFMLLLEKMEILYDNFKSVKKDWDDLQYRLKVSIMPMFTVFRK